MHAKPYPEEKRRTLTERSVDDFVTFLKEVTDQTGNQFIREKLLQSQVPGFRPRRAPLSRTVPILIAKLKSEHELTNCDSPIWDSLTNAWMYWVKSHPELDDALTAFDNGVDFDDDHKCIKPPNSALDIECFKFLLKASRKTSIHQEMIRRFYEYGYFNEDEQIQNLINQFLSCEEIEQKERLEMLPDRVDKLFQAINELSQNVENLDSRVSAVESANGLEQKFTQRIVKERQYFDAELQKLEQKVIDKHKLLDTRLSRIESSSTQLAGLMRRISSLDARILKLSDLVNSFEGKLTEMESVNRQEIDQLINQRVQDRVKQLSSQEPQEIKSFEVRLDVAESAIFEIKSKMTDEPRIAAQALKLGKWYEDGLKKKTERYKDENEYLEYFCHNLRRLGVTDSENEEMAMAIHITLKAFPAVEIADTRIIKVWELTCDNHFYDTTMNVEMGWLGLQDWFPEFFAEESFGIELERIELKASSEKMLEVGNMPWAVYFLNCDRSFPETYLPGFLDWINGICKGGIKVFLIRSFGTNRCETNEDFYERVARLPKPKSREPIESRHLRPSRIPLTLSEWESWCRPNPDNDPQYKIQYDFLKELRLTIENKDVQVPIELLREIQHYLRLSHNIMEKNRALDWALTLRLLPWIGSRRRLIDAVLNLVNDGNQELPDFRTGLQAASETDE